MLNDERLVARLIEALQAFANRGLPPAWGFWRSYDGVEVDLLLEAGGRVFPVEIQLTATPPARHVEPLVKLRSWLGADAEPGLLVCRVAAPKRSQPPASRPPTSATQGAFKAQYADPDEQLTMLAAKLEEYFDNVKVGADSFIDRSAAAINEPGSGVAEALWAGILDGIADAASGVVAAPFGGPRPRMDHPLFSTVPASRIGQRGPDLGPSRPTRPGFVLVLAPSSPLCAPSPRMLGRRTLHRILPGGRLNVPDPRPFEVGRWIRGAPRQGAEGRPG